MPAYVQHHHIETDLTLCPGCIGRLPMEMREVAPHGSLGPIELVYECCDCGTEVHHSVTRPEPRH